MTDEVRKRSPRIEAISACWSMITALMGGTPSMRAAGKACLPQWPNEDEGYYQKRLATATLLPAFARTVDVLSGKPFSRPLTLGDDVPKKLVQYAQNIDLQGTNLHSFVADIFEEAMAYGISGILIDYPTVDTTQTMTVAKEIAAGARPYWVKIPSESLLDIKSTRINGKEIITQLRYVEVVAEEVPGNEFTEKMIEQVRVLDIGRWRIFRQKENKAGKLEWALHSEGKTTMETIPFVPVYGNRKGFLQSSPPLLDLAYLNVEHWQSKSDQQTILHVARVPILFGTNLHDEAIVVGAASAITSDNPGADLKYVEHTGKAIEAGRQDLLDLEDKMRQIGAELLVIKPGRVTVAQSMSEDEAGTSALQRMVKDLEDSVDQALQVTAEWVKEASGGHCNIFNDFGVSSLAEASAQLLLDMNLAGVVSDETLFGEIQRRGIVRDDVVWKEEQARIKAQPSKSNGKTQTTLIG